MPRTRFVIDGSNLATEGRTMPSFAQLREAVDALRAEHPDSTITVVVDASFEHRIDKSEQPAFHAAEAAGDVVSPPAGAIGRGDGFLLQIANRTGGTVVSNDSFQEFHGEYDWLFETGRLIGGKPVPGVGWIFSLRSPVRGPKSHRAVRTAARESRTDKAVTAAIAAATADALSPRPSTSRRRRRARSAGPPPGAVNDPHPFLMFVINHPLGDEVEGSVEEFASHGAFVTTDGVRAYVPLTAMGDPPPTRARDAMQRGTTRSFVVQAFDAPRRGVELALPGYARIAGEASPETVEAEIGDDQAAPARAAAKATKPAKVARAPKVAKAAAKAAKKAPVERTAKTTTAKTAAKVALRKTAANAAKRAPARSAAAKKAAAAKQRGTEKRAGEKKAGEKKAAAPKERAAEKSSAEKKAVEMKRGTRKRSGARKPTRKTTS